MAAKIYKDSIGIGIEVDTKLTADLLASSTVHYIEVTKPSGGTPAIWVADIVEDTGKILHYAIAGDLNEAGDYLLQAVLEFGASVTRGNTVRMRVFDEFK